MQHPDMDITSPASPGPQGRVMIVDDDRSILISVKTVLSEAGFHVDIAEGGQACLLLLRAGFFGVILLDIMMPGMDGWDTIRAINDEGMGEKVLIVMLTAKNTPDEKMLGLQEFVFNYITKPFEPDELVSKVRLYTKYLGP